MAEGFSFDEILDLIIDDAEAISTQMSVEDMAKVTKAGAGVFKVQLESITKAKHYRERKTGKDPHLADTLEMQNKNIDGFKDGSSVVGWNKEESYIVNFIENGTKFPMYSKKGKKYKRGGQVAVVADHFVRDLRENDVVRTTILEAEATAMKKIVDKRSGR